MPLPVIFTPHGGGPIPLLESADGLPAFWSNKLHKIIRASLAGIKAIMIITAHWEENQITISAGKGGQLLFDYYGFPPETYKYKYPAPSSPDFAQQAHKLLSDAGFKSNLDLNRGWDHGVFVPMLKINPEADIPIIQCSIMSSYDPEQHLKMGEALAPLRDQGVLMIGSGLSFHNMKSFFSGSSNTSATFTGKSFDDALQSLLTNPNLSKEERWQKLKDWKKLPGAMEAHPLEDHLVPLFVIVGAGGSLPARRIFNTKMMGTFYTSAWQFGEWNTKDEL